MYVSACQSKAALVSRPAGQPSDTRSPLPLDSAAAASHVLVGPYRGEEVIQRQLQALYSELLLQNLSPARRP